jgi:hypothetical protein
VLQGSLQVTCWSHCSLALARPTVHKRLRRLTRADGATCQASLLKFASASNSVSFTAACSQGTAFITSWITPQLALHGFYETPCLAQAAGLSDRPHVLLQAQYMHGKSLRTPSKRLLTRRMLTRAHNNIGSGLRRRPCTDLCMYAARKYSES